MVADTRGSVLSPVTVGGSSTFVPSSLFIIIGCRVMGGGVLFVESGVLFEDVGLLEIESIIPLNFFDFSKYYKQITIFFKLNLLLFKLS